MALTSQELEQARTLRLQGKSTDEVFNYIAGKRVNAPSRLSTIRKEPLSQSSTGASIISDIPQDILTGVKQLGEGYQDRYTRLKESGAALARGEQGVAETGVQFASNIAGGAIADPAYQLLRTGASFATTPEQETKIAEKVGQTVQDVGAKTGITNWYTGLDDRTKRNVNAALDIADVLPVGIFGKVKSAFKGRQAIDATPKIEDAIIRAEAGDTSDAVRIANTTLDETTRATEVQKLGQAYQDSLVGDRVKVNRLLQEQAQDMSRGDVVVTQDDLVQALANEGVIPDIRGKLADFTTEIRNLDKRQNELFKAYQPVLEASKATASIDDFASYAKRSIADSRNLGFELNKAEAQLDTVVENLRRKYGDNLSAKQIDEISREANARSKAYREGGNTFEADIYSELGRGARTWLNDNIPDNAFREVNDEWLRLEQVKRTAETMQNQQIDVGLLGRALGSYVTTLTGVTLASGVANPFMGVAAGILTKMGGDAIADMMRSTRFAPEIRAKLQERLTTDKALIEKLKQTSTTEEAKNLYDQLSRMLPAPKEGASQSSVNVPMQQGGAGVRSAGTPVETAREGAVRQPEGTATPTVLEATLARDEMAVNQALMEMEVAVNERQTGSNIAVNTEGQYYRFKTLPTWIPKELRDGDLLDRVMKNISEGKKPRGNATQEQQLQEVVEAHISSRVKELKNTDTPTDSGVFSGDIAFAATLIAGGTYYLQSNDGTIAPVIAMGAMMKNPKLAKLVKESDLDKKFRRQEEELWKERGMETGGDGTLKDVKKNNSSALVEEARKYKSAEEFVKAQPTAYHFTSPETRITKWSTKNAFGRVWFTDNPNVGGNVGASGKGKMYTVYMDKKAKWATPEQADKSYTDQLIAEGYDGVYHTDSSGEYGNYYEVFNPKVIQSKSQLTDIWKKANKK